VQLNVTIPSLSQTDEVRTCKQERPQNQQRYDLGMNSAKPYHMLHAQWLELTNQKNGIWGELIGLGRSSHPTWCPIYAILSWIKDLHSHNASLTTPLNAYYDCTWKHIDTSTLTMCLCTTVSVLGAHYGIKSSDISVQSLRASCTMAPKRTSRHRCHLSPWPLMFGRDALIFACSVFPLITPLALPMLCLGTYTVIPNNAVNGSRGGGDTQEHLPKQKSLHLLKQKPIEFASLGGHLTAINFSVHLSTL
jgi:hypothetical protein